MTDAQVADLKQYFETTLTTAISQSEMRVIDLLSDRMDESFQAFREEMAAEFRAVRQEVAIEFKAVRQEMATEFKAVRHEMAVEFSAVRQEMWDGFKGCGDTVEQLGSLIDKDHKEVNKRLAKLERRAA